LSLNVLATIASINAIPTRMKPCFKTITGDSAKIELDSITQYIMLPLDL